MQSDGVHNKAIGKGQMLKDPFLGTSRTIQELLYFRNEVSPDPPLLVLGQFERVGSTFYCDQLEKSRLVHNEPYKLLMPSSWPIARGYKGRLIQTDEFFGSAKIDAVDKHWLRNLTAALHYPGGQVVKETNLYLALPQFLSLFPYSNVELLTRNPLGIISSFKRNDLYHRWQYADVAETLKTQIDRSRPEGHEPLRYMLDQGDTWQAKLAWMIGLNAVLLSRHVDKGRVTRVVSYEDDIVTMGTPENIVHGRGQDSIFGTNIYKTKDDFEARYTADEITALVQAMADCAAFVKRTFKTEELCWFDQLYASHLDRAYIGKAENTHELGRVSNATEGRPQSIIVPAPQLATRSRKLVRLHEELPVLWDYSLVTNQQMGHFLQAMIDSGQDASLNYLLIMDDMPPTRGGRITYDAQSGAYKATEGFDEHPAYWVSWLAAALYAYSVGMRLPTYAEWRRVYDDKYVRTEHLNANRTYANDDTVPTGTGSDSLPGDFFGNLKIWCADWSNQQAVSKVLAGISWKHYFHEKYATRAERPYLTNARWIGLRLVCCSECPAPRPRGMDDVRDKFRQVVSLMRDTRVKTVDDLGSLNEKISAAVMLPLCRHQDNSAD